MEEVIPRDLRPEVDALGRESIGSYLSAQRKLRGITLDELATRTRIPRRNLERLESGAFDAQPDGFVRGFVRAVALELGLDVNEAVMRLVGEPVAADDDWQRRRRLGVLAAVGALGLLLLGLAGYTLRAAARWVASPVAGIEAQHVQRVDAVRELWLEQALAPAQAADEARGSSGGDAEPGGEREPREEP